MNKVNLKSSLTLLSLIALSTQAFAQTSVPPAVDRPYQSQVLIRYGQYKTVAQKFATIDPAAKVGAYYRPQGSTSVQSAQPTQVLKAATVISPYVLAAIRVAGLNYEFYDDGLLTTVSANGVFNVKGKNDFKPDKTGGVFFRDANTNHLVVVDASGYFADTFMDASDMQIAGGNYYIDSQGVLTTIKSAGVAPGNSVGMVTTKLTPPGADSKEWTYTHTLGTGGNYFVKSDGAIVTVSSLTGFTSSFISDSRPKLLGGNYFIGSDNLLYTISSTGNLAKTKRVISETPKVVGYSFMQFANGSILTIDSAGVYHEQVLSYSKTSSMPELLTSFPEAIDPASVYLPSTAN